MDHPAQVTSHDAFCNILTMIPKAQACQGTAASLLRSMYTAKARNPNRLTYSIGCKLEWWILLA